MRWAVSYDVEWNFKHSWRVHKRQFSSNSDLACIKMWVSSKLECDVVFFSYSSLCVCVWFAHSGHSLSVSVWTLIDSCSHAPWGQLTCSYTHLSFSLSVHPFLILLFHSLPLSLQHINSVSHVKQWLICSCIYNNQLYTSIIKHTCLNTSTIYSKSHWGNLPSWLRTHRRDL